MGLGLLIAAIGHDPAQAAWQVASTEHFDIYADEAPDVVRVYAEKLEKFDRILRLNQSIAPRPTLPGDRLTIFVLPLDAVQSVIGPGASNIAGIYRPSVTGSIVLTSASRQTGKRDMTTQIVLLHEYAHHFMLSNFPATYPTWFVEGYAEFVSTVRFEDNGDIGIGYPVLHRGYEMNWVRTMRIEDMMTGKAGYGALLETKGWLMTHYLTFEPSRRGQLAAFLAALNEGKAPLDAAKAVFGDLRAFNAELTVYSRRKSFTYSIMDAKLVPPVSATVRALSPGEAALMTVKMNSRFGVNQREAKRRVAEARRLSAPFADDPAVQCILAEAEDDADFPDGADAAADRLLALKPGSACGMIFKGLAATRRAKAAKAPAGDKAWATARDWFVRANRAERENPWPMYLYYQSFRQAGATPTANAVTALLAAQQRAPQDPLLRYDTTLQLLRDGRAADARVMLTPLVGNRHNGKSELEQLFARIGQEDPKKIAADLDEKARKEEQKD